MLIQGRHGSNSQDYKMEQIRLKTQLNDLKQKLIHKTQELNQIMRDVKTTKINELQTETQIYQKECLKLRGIAEQALGLAIGHGLVKQVKKNKVLKGFMRNMSPQTRGGIQSQATQEMPQYGQIHPFDFSATSSQQNINAKPIQLGSVDIEIDQMKEVRHVNSQL